LVMSRAVSDAPRQDPPPLPRQGPPPAGAGHKSEPHDRFYAQHPVLEVARDQHGVVSLAEIKAAGLSARVAQNWAASGRLHRIHHGVYSIAPPELLSRRGHYMAAVLACGDNAVLSHRSAAALHGLRATARSRIEVTVPGRVRRYRAGLQVHRSTTLTPADVTVKDGIPVTTVARTLADLADVLPDRAVERALEQAASLEILDGRALNDQLARHPRAACLRRLTKRGPIASPTESDLEELFLSECRRAGLPEPERQGYIDPGDGGPMIRADFVWSDQRLIVETDGARTHGTRRSFESDRRRDQRLIAAGWRVIRVTWRQLIESPQEVIDLLTALLRTNS
jgi:predicted transcriptional regulator of viral defense system